MSIKNNIAEIRKHIPENVKLVCVSKFHPETAILEAYNSGERIFGESRVQEMAQKQPLLPSDIHWHFIGHLQSNKIKYMIDFVELIHGVHSFKLLQEINKHAEKAGRRVACLLQVHIAQEETKFGFTEEELCEMMESAEFKGLNHVEIYGLMGMATFTDDEKRVRSEFQMLKTLFDKFKMDYFSNNPFFTELSMGMSDDYKIAMEEGSTMVRVGSAIFGHRY